MELHSDFLHSRPSYIFLHRDASWEWWHRSVLPGRARLGHFTLTTPKSQPLKSEGLLFTQATRPLWTLRSSALHCPYSTPYHPQLVEPLLSSLLPWQQTGNLMKYILVHKEEVKHLTSAHISLVQTNYMAVPNFLCSPEGMLVNITNNSHTRQVKKIKSNSASKNNQQGSEPPKLWNSSKSCESCPMGRPRLFEPSSLPLEMKGLQESDLHGLSQLSTSLCCSTLTNIFVW